MVESRDERGKAERDRERSRHVEWKGERERESERIKWETGEKRRKWSHVEASSRVESVTRTVLGVRSGHIGFFESLGRCSWFLVNPRDRLQGNPVSRLVHFVSDTRPRHVIAQLLSSSGFWSNLLSRSLLYQRISCSLRPAATVSITFPVALFSSLFPVSSVPLSLRTEPRSSWPSTRKDPYFERRLLFRVR